MTRHPLVVLRTTTALTFALPLVLLALLLSFVSPPPAAAQFGGGVVKDPWNLVENAATASSTAKTVFELRDQLRRMDQNLEAWENVFRRDRLDYFAWLNELAAQGEPWSYAVPDVYGLYKEAVQPFLAFTPEVLEEIDAGGLYEIWQGSAIDTFAATLAAAAEQGAAELESEDDRAELQGALAGSTGNLEALQALGMIDLHVAQEVSRLNQLLASVVSNQTAYYGHSLATLGTTEATNRYLLDAELALLEEEGTVTAYDDSEGFTGLPPGVGR